MSRIANASIISKITLLIESDIRELETFLNNDHLNETVSDFLESLKIAKKTIMEYLPKMEGGSSNIPTTDAEFQNNKYSVNKLREAVIEGDILNLVRSIEANQYKALKKSLSPEGLPNAFESKIQNILSIYLRLLHQLDRDKLTSQLNPISL